MGCGTSGSSGGDDNGGDAMASVKIDGAGSVAVADAGGAALPGSPFACTGGNCGGTDVATTTTSIKFTATPTPPSTLLSATIEIGGGTPTSVTAATAITVDPAAGWTLTIVFGAP